MKLVIELILFAGTTAFTMMWFSNTVFPLLVGLPLAIHWAARGVVRWRAPAAWLVAPALWQIIPFALGFAAAAVFSSEKLLQFAARPGVVYGQLAGLFMMVLGLFRRATWRDLRSEFWSFQLLYLNWPKISSEPRLAQLLLTSCAPHLQPNDFRGLVEKLASASASSIGTVSPA